MVSPVGESPLELEWRTTPELDPATKAAVLALCRDAYEEDLDGYLADIGAGTHLLGRVDGHLVSHGMLVARTLITPGLPPLYAAYVELVATSPRAQRRGYAKRLLRHLAVGMDRFDIGALSPSDPLFYAPLGWEEWRGALGVRTSGGVEPTPDESVMILRLPRTPVSLDLSQTLSVEWRPGEIW